MMTSLVAGPWVADDHLAHQSLMRMASGFQMQMTGELSAVLQDWPLQTLRVIIQISEHERRSGVRLPRPLILSLQDHQFHMSTA